jgi:hypothetical protein
MDNHTKKRNDDYDWNYNPETYLKGNYEVLIPEDHHLSRVAIHALIDCKGDAFGTLKHGLHIGIGAVPRGSALITPFMAHPKSGAKITMGDIGQIKLDATKKLMASLRSNDLGIWQAHEDDMAETNSLWRGTFQAAAHLSEVKELDMFKLKENTYDIASAEHLFESATQDPEEYKLSLRRFFRSVKPGGVIHMAYVVGSEGYTVGGKEYPAYPVMPDEVVRYASEELTNIQNFFTSASGQMREEKDTHGYKGLGVLVGIRKTV